jgi:hypothetical protein
MSNEVTVNMPLHLTSELMKAVRENELTRCDDKDEMNTRIGWLMCAYDVMVETRCASSNVELRGDQQRKGKL